MRYKRLLLVVSLVSLLLKVNQLSVSAKIPDSAHLGEIAVKIWRNNNSNSFNNRGFNNHGSRAKGDDDASEEQKRTTPSGANPLHNR